MLNRGLIPHTWFLWLSVGVIIAFNAGYATLTWLLSEYLNRAPSWEPAPAAPAQGQPAGRLPCAALAPLQAAGQPSLHFGSQILGLQTVPCQPHSRTAAAAGQQGRQHASRPATLS